MQCPKCKYEPTMSEMQSSPDACPKCSVIYSKVSTKERPSNRVQQGRRGLGGITKVIAAVVLVAVTFGGWNLYQYRQALAAIDEQVRLSSAYVTQIVTALDDSGSMTFAEFFEKANKGIAEIDASMVRVSVIQPSTDASALALAYMKKSQEVIRGTAQSMRSMLALSSAKSQEDKAEADLLSSNEYIRERAGSSRIAALDAQLKALGDIKEARENLATVAEEMRVAAGELIGVSETALVGPPIYERLTSFKK